jgi:hypothetical protein
MTEDGAVADKNHWRCRRTEGETAPESQDDADHACWIQPPDGPRMSIQRSGGCLADTVDEAERCAEETMAPDPGGK